MPRIDIALSEGQFADRNDELAFRDRVLVIVSEELSCKGDDGKIIVLDPANDCFSVLTVNPSEAHFPPEAIFLDIRAHQYADRDKNIDYRLDRIRDRVESMVKGAKAVINYSPIEKRHWA
jgi:hypothetical protein